MGDKIFFITGDKSFELVDTNEDYGRWFLLIERGRRFTCSLKIDEVNLRWVCEALKEASLNTGNSCRRWGRKIQVYTCSVFQNFNIHGRFVRVESLLGNKKSAVIIPKVSYNSGWGDIAGKILRFMGKGQNPRFQLAQSQIKPYIEAAKITQWPAIPGTAAAKADGKNPAYSSPAEHDISEFLSKCLIGCFNDSFNFSPKSEVIQKWFTNRWQVTAGPRVTPISRNQFLFNLPSRQEANRVKAGEWFWNGRKLSLKWWSLVSGSEMISQRKEQRWINAFGIPLHS